jgi:hypothetical protein
MLSILFALVVVGALSWLWRDSLRARELAVIVCRRNCESENLQFLDDTVALSSLHPTFTYGRPMLRRVYQFDFSREGNDRQSGTVILCGPHLETLYIPGQQDDDSATATSGAVVINLDQAKRKH